MSDACMGVPEGVQVLRPERCGLRGHHLVVQALCVLQQGPNTGSLTAAAVASIRRDRSCKP